MTGSIFMVTVGKYSSPMGHLGLAGFPPSQRQRHENRQGKLSFTEQFQSLGLPGLPGGEGGLGWDTQQCRDLGNDEFFVRTASDFC